MLIEDVKELSHWNQYVYWIKEREAIRKKKESGAPKPWTDDEILLKYRFCNVRRMDDKVSRWLMTNWYLPYQNHPNMLWACALARFINLPSSLELITPMVFTKTKAKPYWERIKLTLRNHRDKGNTIFNGAYMVRGNDGFDKIESVVDHNVKTIEASINRDSMEETWNKVVLCYGIGSFMAGQIVADLRYGLRGGWKDRYRWAAMGPGSQRGMNRLLGFELNSSMKQFQFEGYLKATIDHLREHLPDEIFLRLEAIDFQNTLCEFDKYQRTLHDNRRPKSLYPGKA